MIRVLKNLVKLIVLANVLLFAGWFAGQLCGEVAFCTLLGLFLGLVPVMVGFLQLWDYVIQATNGCWMCGREQLSGRVMYVSDWYKQGENGDGCCGRCGTKLVQRGDRVFGRSLGKAA